MRLYEITHAIIEQQHEAVNTDDLDALQLAFQDKAIGCVCVIKNLNAEIDAIDSEIKRLGDLKTTRQNNVDRLKAYLLNNMQAADVQKIANGVHQIRRQLSPLSVQVFDENLVPAEFRVEIIERRIDKKAIAAHIKDTGEIPNGIDAKRNEHLRIQ